MKIEIWIWPEDLLLCKFFLWSIFKYFSVTKDKTILLCYSLDSPIRRKYLINSPRNSFSFNRIFSKKREKVNKYYFTHIKILLCNGFWGLVAKFFAIDLLKSEISCCIIRFLQNIHFTQLITSFKHKNLSKTYKK